MPSAASADMAKGYYKPHDIDFTFTNTRFEEREKTTGGLSPVAVLVSDLELNDGSTSEVTWEIAPVEWFNDKDTQEPRAAITEEGKFVDIDLDHPYEIASWSEVGALFLSLEHRGISASVMAQLCAKPELLNGVKAHGIQEPNGKPYVAKKGAKKGQTIQNTVLVVETILEDPNADRKKAGKPAAKPGAAATSSSKPAGRPPATTRKPAPEPEPEPEEEQSTVTDEIGAEDQACINTVNEVLGDPKKHVKTFSSRQNGGGVTVMQMATAAMTAYKPKAGDPKKADVVALIKDPDWADAWAENGGWTFDKAKGIYFPAE